MRTAYAIALALSVSLAVVRANETPEPLFVDAVAPIPQTSSNTSAADLPSNRNESATPSLSEPAAYLPRGPIPYSQSAPSDGYRPETAEPGAPQPATPDAPSDAAFEESIVRPTPAPPKPPKVWVMLKAKSFEINTDNSPRTASPEQMAYLLCDNVTTTSHAGGATTLKCTNCKVTLPNGVSATASDVAYDTKTNVLILNGSDKSPVTLTMGGTESKAPKVEMKIDPSSWRNAPFGTQVQSTSYALPATGSPTPANLPVPSAARNY